MERQFALLGLKLPSVKLAKGKKKKKIQRREIRVYLEDYHERQTKAEYCFMEGEDDLPSFPTLARTETTEQAGKLMDYTLYILFQF